MEGGREGGREGLQLRRYATCTRRPQYVQCYVCGSVHSRQYAYAYSQQHKVPTVVCAVGSVRGNEDRLRYSRVRTGVAYAFACYLVLQ